MDFIKTIKERAKNNIKKIILPETMDERVLKAAAICHKEKIAEIILIGKEDEVEYPVPEQMYTIIKENKLYPQIYFHDKSSYYFPK